MRMWSKSLIIAIVGCYLAMTGCKSIPDAKAVKETIVDPLPSWNDGPTKKAITDFVARVTNKGSADFVPEATASRPSTMMERCGWSSRSIRRAIFTNDRIQQLAPQHPEWKTKQPFAAVLNHDRKALAASEEKGAVAQLLAVTHTGMTTDEFDKTVSDWIAQARHPRFKQPFTQCIYQPMVEVLNYLRANDSRRISSRAASRSS